MRYTGHQLEQITGGILSSGGDRVCTGVSTDSRTTQPGDLFVALVGDRFDGHDFIDTAIARGAAGCLTMPGHPMDLGERVHIVVPETLDAFGEIARAHLGQMPARVVAITGSNGKTTTKEMVAVALGAHGSVVKNRGNFNNLIGLPLTACRVDESHDFAVLEMGMNRPGEIARLTQIAQPDVGVITQVAPAHLEGLVTVDAVTWAKGELFVGLAPTATAVVNTLDANVLRAANGVEARRLTVGSEGCDLNVQGIRRRGVAAFLATLEVGGKRYSMEIRAMAEHDVWNAALALACVHALGLDLEPSLEALRKHTQVRGRLCWKVSNSGVNVIDDTYNANPSSMRAALRTLAEVSGDQRRIAVLGDMLEMGTDAAKFHHDVGQMAFDVGVEQLFCAGQFAANMADGYMERGVVLAGDAMTLIPRVVAAVRAGDWVLVKGSRGMRMERVVAALMGEEAAA